jgi:hypothetical protein
VAAERVGHRPTFYAPFDTVVLTITTVCLVVLGIIVFSFVFSQPGNSVWRALFGLGAVLLLVASYGFSPKAYRIERDMLIVERPIGRVVVPLTDLQRVSTDQPEWRTLGRFGFVNGIFGLYGRLYTRDRGWTYFWGRRAHNAVVLAFPHRRVLLMPHNPKSFATAVREAAWSNDF